jgi:hypothetical protein
MSLYLLGYALFVTALGLALWKWGVLEAMGAFWTGVSILLALGVGVMISVSNSGRKENITIDTK